MTIAGVVFVRRARPLLAFARARTRLRACAEGAAAVSSTLVSIPAAEAQRILDRAARRLLAARLDRDAVGAAAGTNDGAIDHGADQSAPLVKRQQVPVPRANGDRRRGGSK